MVRKIKKKRRSTRRCEAFATYDEGFVMREGDSFVIKSVNGLAPIRLGRALRASTAAPGLSGTCMSLCCKFQDTWRTGGGSLGA